MRQRYDKIALCAEGWVAALEDSRNKSQTRAHAQTSTHSMNARTAAQTQMRITEQQLDNSEITDVCEEAYQLSHRHV
jgi:hypothetical protein